MRVVHLLRKYNPAEWGGTETALLQLASGLRQHNVSSVMFCPRISNGVLVDPLAESGCSIKRYRACLPIWGLPVERKRQLIAVGGNMVSFDLIAALWKEAGVSLIHSHTLGRLGGVALTVAQRRKVPMVVTIHGGFMDLPDSVRQTLERQAQGGWDWGRIFGALLQSRRVLEKANAILTCNAREAALLQAKYPAQRVLVHPHSVPVDRYREDHRKEARHAFPAIRDRQVLLTVGRIDGPKNQAWLVEQAPEVFRKHARALLVMAGACTDESYGKNLMQRIKELGLEQRILLTGGLSPADPRLIGLYQEAAVLVLPSKSETFGLVVLEAWAAGTAVLSSRTSGARALITQGQDGWLFDLDEPKSFHEAVDDTLLHPSKTKELAAAGHRRACADYDPGVLAGRMKELYEQLIEANHAPRNSARR